MLSNLKPVWIVAQRELRDQLRDWRVLFPLAVLTTAFPFLMMVMARGVIDFINQYGADLVIDALVPFSVLLIGFFPNTISLVVALETFVGEKERGTIEPLLSSPMKDWQIYLGKLVVGVLTPLIASFLAIAVYLVLVSRLDLTMPSAGLVAQLIILTTGHAILMVSGAIVISVQSTSVKAANLLASFIIIPVAFLVQGESVLLFWGNGRILWVALVGVMVLASLFVRMGIAHFQREYLLGREIDTLNIRWMWVTFWRSFLDGAHSIGEWYRIAVATTLRRLALPTLIMVLVFLAGGWLGYDQVTLNAPNALKDVSSLAELRENVASIPSANGLGEVQISAPFIFMNNIRATALMFLFGMLTFGVLGILVYLLNAGLIGGVLSLFAYFGVSPWVLFSTGILPHGLFELPALMLSGAAVLHMAVALVTPQTGRSMGEVFIDQVADWAKVFLGVIIPLLLVASLIETYVTPVILKGVLHW
ncbi:MAG: stage II sporulation protein M [Chloroflexi bacterium]|nr:stage II sporulation protein M [Chloroflexota bacterium]